MDKQIQNSIEQFVQNLSKSITEAISDQFSEMLKSHSIASTQTPKSKYFGIKEAAEYLKIAPQTLYGLTSKRAIRFIKVSKKVLFTEQDLEDYLAKGKKETASNLVANYRKRRINAA
ncbi:DNA binding domain protein, excisionase family [Emticicia oligotrophica DSM 17448]|uniref:DNA binding domain protein, excisionase family n=1 Tax=Emticicia oligotrophica (strain DSM 17448 / CIP 109782 / MTCC 6937 / GPTSA100-15) TaxID=929562 RepID=A0ABM5N3X6_EMTOG|nr:helix-turn-helix domain-containing protein [Emticicia oligotrophica]AFK04135.1 DNA binding domain protein, excisionase family [Emticicia oligotrophica DSM 17448]